MVKQYNTSAVAMVAATHNSLAVAQVFDMRNEFKEEIKEPKNQTNAILREALKLMSASDRSTLGNLSILAGNSSEGAALSVMSVKPRGI